jgi:hypothetical protein
VTSNLPRITLRIETEIVQKLKRIADYNARSLSSEIRFNLTRYVEDFAKNIQKLKLMIKVNYPAFDFELSLSAVNSSNETSSAFASLISVGNVGC